MCERVQGADWTLPGEGVQLAMKSVRLAQGEVPLWEVDWTLRSVRGRAQTPTASHM